VAAGALLAISLFVMLAPARLRCAPWLWRALFTGLHAAIWIAVLIILLDEARREVAAKEF
jgi:hypothetical protein